MAQPLSIKMIEERGKLVVLMSIERGAAVLDPEDVDAVIQYLSLLRASMRPAVPERPPHAQQFVTEMDPCWYAERHPLEGGAVLLLRHSGLGWAGFALPPRSLERLHGSLTQLLEDEQQAISLPH
ncbi:hypothetical protein WT97_13735 [Burkholderia sp. MSMB1459WGS]|uniref:hypothetical protein n=1 Tax=unclassified Burkholderia TaxID=2613784 RepID=UPI00075DDBEF|nr:MULTISPECIES: hypothetical protein [unclassified Burkholderia]KVT16551.1 hypothetical protein WT24_05045 [Burkholderia sp. MSMB1078WGS]KWO46119.1 hypothetical protein WT97_13735 [Burkholderia sp. MSMB1459WGS]